MVFTSRDIYEMILINFCQRILNEFNHIIHVKNCYIIPIMATGCQYCVNYINLSCLSVKICKQIHSYHYVLNLLTDDEFIIHYEF